MTTWWSNPASAVPYDNTTSGLTATTTQAAIDEVLDALYEVTSYPVQANYNGNANVGRYLEVFPGEDTSTAPILVPTNSTLLHVTIQAAATTNGSVTIYNLTTTTNIYVASFSGTAKQTFTNLNLPGINASDELQFIVSGASINKPKIRIWLQGA
jgi:hypothetical protein